jgi:hypothetical protein
MKQKNNQDANPRLPKRAYRIGEFCESFGFSRSKVYEWMSSGKIQYSQVDGVRVIREEEADAFLARHEKKATGNPYGPEGGFWKEE